MTITLDIPDDFAQFTRPGQDLARLVLEDAELDGLLKARRVWLEYTLEDLKRDQENHRKLSL